MAKNSASIPPVASDLSDGQWDSEDAYEAIEHHSETDTYRTSFDSTTDSVALAVVLSVAAVEETNPQELPSLSSIVDWNALEALIQPEETQSEKDRHVTFNFVGYQVTVHSYGIIAVRPAHDSTTVEQ